MSSRSNQNPFEDGAWPQIGDGVSPQSESSAPTQSLEHELPIAMGLEEARILLARAHPEAGISMNDPIMMNVTLHQGFCGDLAKINQACIHQVQSLLQAYAKDSADGVETMLEGLKDKTIQASIQHALALTEQFTKTIENHQRSIKRFTWISGAAALVCLLSGAFLFSFVQYITP